MQPEQKLETLFALDAAPRRDPAFEAMVAERIARRRAVANVAGSAPLAIAGVSMIWGLQPILANLVDGAIIPGREAAVLCAAVLALVSALAVVRQILRA